MTNKKDMTVFQLRIPEELHERLRVAAFNSRQSMNSFILDAIDALITVDTLGKAHKTVKKAG